MANISCIFMTYIKIIQNETIKASFVVHVITELHDCSGATGETETAYPSGVGFMLLNLSGFFCGVCYGTLSLCPFYF